MKALGLAALLLLAGCATQAQAPRPALHCVVLYRSTEPPTIEKLICQKEEDTP